MRKWERPDALLVIGTLAIVAILCTSGLLVMTYSVTVNRDTKGVDTAALKDIKELTALVITGLLGLLASTKPPAPPDTSPRSSVTQTEIINNEDNPVPVADTDAAPEGEKGKKS